LGVALDAIIDEVVGVFVQFSLLYLQVGWVSNTISISDCFRDADLVSIDLNSVKSSVLVF
jgi:hypothetical protein